ncbi:MAG: methyltransferase domain-containing protein [Clostridia bacterium]|nr:methyltransferase domain-containing protein [Clostridia bacterium]
MPREFRLVFDSIADDFDRFRPTYSPALYEALIPRAGIGPGCFLLELGPGTGQATEPLLRTGCNYLGIELGKHLAARLKEKFGHYSNFSLIRDDFITHDFGAQRFDVILSAATIQWIPPEIAFDKTFRLLKPGGMLAMMMLHGDYRSHNEALYQRIQQVYAHYWKPEEPYRIRFPYDSAPDYGYTDYIRQEFPGSRVMDADTFAAHAGTHADHITIPEPYRTAFFAGLRDAVNEHGGSVTWHDTHVLITAKKPL